mmetsp:Transcript_27746/g.67669  ORF Transcript_27746/g.67669 Transcript_27746/m.67669 type:complete len:238 (-) Transcript_27746:159-872(-)
MTPSVATQTPSTRHSSTTSSSSRPAPPRAAPSSRGCPARSASPQSTGAGGCLSTRPHRSWSAPSFHLRGQSRCPPKRLSSSSRRERSSTPTWRCATRCPFTCRWTARPGCLAASTTPSSTTLCTPPRPASPTTTRPLSDGSGPSPTSKSTMSQRYARRSRPPGAAPSSPWLGRALSTRLTSSASLATSRTVPLTCRNQRTLRRASSSTCYPTSRRAPSSTPSPSCAPPPRSTRTFTP